MILKYEDFTDTTSVYCKGITLGYIQPNKYVRREKSTEFSGMNTNFYYDSLEEAKKKLPLDLEKYFKELIEWKG